MICTKLSSWASSSFLCVCSLEQNAGKVYWRERETISTKIPLKDNWLKKLQAVLPEKKKESCYPEKNSAIVGLTKSLAQCMAVWNKGQNILKYLFRYLAHFLETKLANVAPLDWKRAKRQGFLHISKSEEEERRKRKTKQKRPSYLYTRCARAHMKKSRVKKSSSFALICD